MKTPRKMAVAGVSIIAALLFPAYAMADDSYEQSSETHAEAWIAADTADIRMMDEIIVLGQKQSQRPRLRLPLGFDPLLKSFKRLDWQFFPAYVPEPVPNRIELGPFRSTSQRTGIIDVFRIRFGHRGNGKL